MLFYNNSEGLLLNLFSSTIIFIYLKWANYNFLIWLFILMIILNELVTYITRDERTYKRPLHILLKNYSKPLPYLLVKLLKPELTTESNWALYLGSFINQPCSWNIYNDSMYFNSKLHALDKLINSVFNNKFSTQLLYTISLIPVFTICYLLSAIQFIIFLIYWLIKLYKFIRDNNAIDVLDFPYDRWDYQGYHFNESNINIEFPRVIKAYYSCEEKKYYESVDPNQYSWNIIIFIYYYFVMYDACVNAYNCVYFIAYLFVGNKYKSIITNRDNLLFLFKHLVKLSLRRVFNVAYNSFILPRLHLRYTWTSDDSLHSLKRGGLDLEPWYSQGTDNYFKELLASHFHSSHPNLHWAMPSPTIRRSRVFSRIVVFKQNKKSLTRMLDI